MAEADGSRDLPPVDVNGGVQYRLTSLTRKANQGPPLTHLRDKREECDCRIRRNGFLASNQRADRCNRLFWGRPESREWIRQAANCWLIYWRAERFSDAIESRIDWNWVCPKASHELVLFSMKKDSPLKRSRTERCGWSEFIARRVPTPASEITRNIRRKK